MVPLCSAGRSFAACVYCTASSHDGGAHLAVSYESALQMLLWTQNPIPDPYTYAMQVSLDLASFEVVRGCAGALLGLLREGLLDIVFCNEAEAAALAEVLPPKGWSITLCAAEQSRCELQFEERRGFCGEIHCWPCFACEAARMQARLLRSRTDGACRGGASLSHGRARATSAGPGVMLGRRRLPAVPWRGNCVPRYVKPGRTF